VLDTNAAPMQQAANDATRGSRAKKASSDLLG
jgi:hypothetical protein